MQKPAVDPANVVQSLVYTLFDVFDATRDLYQTLRAKDKRDYEQSLRSRGYPAGRRSEYVNEEDLSGDESLVMDKAAVNRQFELGLREVGQDFAVGDVLTQTALQSHIIRLQSTVITTFLYGPTTPEPISKHLSTLVAASLEAGTNAVDALGTQRLRQLDMLPPTPRSAGRLSETRRNIAHVPPYPVTTGPSASSASTALARPGRSRSRHNRGDDHVSPYPAMTTIINSRPTVPRTDTESTAFSGPTAYDTESSPHTQCCLYALDLQRHPSQPLSSSITKESTPYCPHCKRTLQFSQAKSWEIYKDDLDRERERCFRVLNRFVVKCHRNSVDGGYCCVFCSRGSSVDTVCGDVKALIKHIWQDHSAAELELEEDIEEIVQRDALPRRRRSGKSAERRRDSGLGAGNRRSVSLEPSRGRGKRRVEREVETVEIRPSRASLRD
ncbi:hypothetical protein CC80DRAFT_407659 [Byssothecium circinans]|uniref:Uncharacterized protein n=1 Tax=Byssothecium circinans TaxID=147558 RepID=A0A6A5U1H0_9PLEO|nr:hypothetical protein CC80DRAFT_407659 [Byssothecium circinans]